MNKEAVIISAARTPVGRNRGVFAEVPAADLGTLAVKTAVERAGIDKNEIDDLIFGNLANDHYANIARFIGLQAGLPITVPGFTIDRQCSSGLNAIALAAMMIESGHDIGQIAYGLMKPTGGQVILMTDQGEEVIKNPIQSLKRQMAYVPKDRDGEAMMMKSTILQNTVLPSAENLEGKFGYLDSASLRAVAEDAKNQFLIKCTGVTQKVNALSGGNKQKVNLGRWLVKDLKVLIVDCPTRGVDVGVKAYIYECLRKAKEKGIATLMITDELSEAMGMADRIVVMKADVQKAPAAKPAPAPVADTADKRVLSSTPYKGVRKIIGDKLSESKFTMPHLYFTDAVDTTNMTAFRKQLNAVAERKITVSDLIVYAAGKALAKFPQVNSSLVDGNVVVYESKNVGVAVAGDNGLIVPVIKNVQEKTLTQVSAEQRDLVDRAKAGKLMPDEYSGGTFSITNLGMARCHLMQQIGDGLGFSDRR